ncbi:MULTISPECIES: hypothetical protein [Streptomyces]|uniref:Flp pilus assembly protein TadB n=1 Tax=Streptomyces demainii TaxID=588122 RepID=A0ABT9KKP5_9ACTN|nr:MULTISPECIES: hypothetical protein [Streptomyces]MBW8087375.1 hypothetical protein [Streptomyces hygroscopicus subsp. hygroscopicus]MCO8305799.1 hypothetical protein [Streptomyces sp. RKCA744]MDP9608999.1 Flp pilus assembly protein TadB [Streptomyces demainii]
MALFLFLVIVAIVLGLIGWVVHGLGYLLIIGAVVLVVDIVLGGVRMVRGSRRRRIR